MGGNERRYCSSLSTDRNLGLQSQDLTVQTVRAGGRFGFRVARLGEGSQGEARRPDERGGRRARLGRGGPPCGDFATSRRRAGVFIATPCTPGLTFSVGIGLAFSTRRKTHTKSPRKIPLEPQPTIRHFSRRSSASVRRGTGRAVFPRGLAKCLPAPNRQSSRDHRELP